MQRVYTQTFGVVGAILERDGKILLIKESGTSDKGKWNQPAGWIDVGEDPLVAVKREVEEETGFEFMPEAFLGIYSLVKRSLQAKQNIIRHPIKLIFIGKISDQPTLETDGEAEEIKWFSPEEIEAMGPDILRDLDIKKEIKDYFAGKKYPLDLISHTVSVN
jgi:8-oxo-dGTP pyrophosphatase MutT (NUDIX family)